MVGPGLNVRRAILPNRGIIQAVVGDLNLENGVRREGAVHGKNANGDSCVRRYGIHQGNHGGGDLLLEKELVDRVHLAVTCGNGEGVVPVQYFHERFAGDHESIGFAGGGLKSALRRPVDGLCDRHFVAVRVRYAVVNGKAGILEAQVRAAGLAADHGGDVA